MFANKALTEYGLLCVNCEVIWAFSRNANIFDHHHHSKHFTYSFSAAFWAPRVPSEAKPSAALSTEVRWRIRYLAYVSIPPDPL